jgi:hypothetical protein
MVFYIRGRDAELKYDSPDLDKIIKLMINISTNIEHFNNKFEYQDSPIKRTNTYKYNTVDFDIMPNYGSIIIYTSAPKGTKPPYLDAKICAAINNRLKSDHFNYIDFNGDYPTNLSNPYTLVLKKSTLIMVVTCDEKNHIRTYKQDIYPFYWTVHVQYSNDTHKHLTVKDFSCSNSDAYLFQSITTIIYDSLDLFNFPYENGYYKQLEYPAIQHYTLYSKHKLLDEKIHIHPKLGLEVELYHLFTNQSIQIVSRYGTYGNNMDIDDVKTLNICYRNLHRSWTNDIQDPILSPKLKEYSNIRNDVCYVSGMPLSSIAISLTLRKSVETPIFHILISPAAYYKEYYDNSYTLYFSDWFEKKCGLNIIKSQLVKYPRSTIDVINMLPNTVNPIKKDIMIAIEKYGYNCIRLHNPQYSLILNIEKNEAYIGTNELDDNYIQKFSNVNAIVCYMEVSYHTKIGNPKK